MQFLKDAHLNVKHHFEKGGKLEFFYPCLLYTSDAADDSKRVWLWVVGGG